MLEQLRKLRPFQELDQELDGDVIESNIDTVKQHVSWLHLPAGRSLLRRGQALPRELFLIEGVVTVRRGTSVEKLSADATGGNSLNSQVGSDADVVSQTDTKLLAVDLAPVLALLNGKTKPPAVTDIDDWMNVLLHGPIMRWFSPSAWARVLRAGEVQRVCKGERIVTEGEVCRHVFVVAEGIAIGAEGRYPPGGFFGEESALGQCPARHDITMETNGAIVRFDHVDVVNLAADYEPPRLDPPPHRFDLDAIAPDREEEALAALNPHPPIAVRSSDPARRLRVSARLMRQGFTVV